MKSKRDDSLLIQRKRKIFVFLALGAIGLVGILLALAIDTALKIVRGERFYANDPSAFIVIGVCLLMIVLLRWATIRTYQHLWQATEKPKRD